MRNFACSFCADPSPDDYSQELHEWLRHYPDKLLALARRELEWKVEGVEATKRQIEYLKWYRKAMDDVPDWARGSVENHIKYFIGPDIRDLEVEATEGVVEEAKERVRLAEKMVAIVEAKVRSPGPEGIGRRAFRFKLEEELT